MSVKRSPRPEAKHWLFTINNYLEPDFELFSKAEVLLSYYIYGKEIAPTTGTPHLQCMIYLLYLFC